MEKGAWHVRLAPYAEEQGSDAYDVLFRAYLAADRDLRSRKGKTAAAETIPEKHNPALLANPWGNIRENAPSATGIMGIIAPALTH